MPLFDAPAAAVPLHFLPSLLGGGDGQIREQHPIDGLGAGRWRRLVDPNGPKGQGRPAFLAADGRGRDGDLGPPNFHLGRAAAAACWNVSSHRKLSFSSIDLALRPRSVAVAGGRARHGASSTPRGTPSGRNANRLCHQSPWPLASPNGPKPVVLRKPVSLSPVVSCGRSTSGSAAMRDCVIWLCGRNRLARLMSFRLLTGRGGSEPAAARADPHPQPVGRAKTPPREAGAIHKGLDQLWPNSVTRPPVHRPARQRQAQHLGGQIGALHRVAEVCATPLWHWPAPAARPIPATPVAHKPPGPAAGAWARAVAPPTR